MKSKRRQFPIDEKFRIIKEFFTTDTGVSEICKKYDIHTSQFYKWQDTFFQGALEGFQNRCGKQSRADQRKIKMLEDENIRMKDVIAEITSENINFKKKSGGF